MSRVAYCLGFGFVFATTLLGTARAETQAEIAAKENEDGKTLMFSGKYAEASEKFQNAVARVPEPKYFFNLCTSRFSEGKFGDALTACNAADRSGDDKLKGKVATLVAKIHEEAKKQGIDLQATGGGGGPGETPPVGGDPNGPPAGGDPTNPGGMQPGGPGGAPGGTAVGQPPSGVVGRPPGIGLFTAAPPENKYTWSLGIDLYTGGGNVGQPARFGNSSGGVRLKADYLLNAKSRIGGEGYFQFTHFGEGENQLLAGAETLDIMDIGVAGYKHFCGPRSRLCITPLLGVQLAMMSPNNDTDGTGSQIFNYAGLGARADIGLDYAMGRRFEHVLGLHVGVNLYTKALSEPMDAGNSAADRGLGQGGRAAYVSLGYTYRFKTPFGSTPFVTLE